MPRTKIEFKTFWDAYGLKRDKKAAEPAWNRLSDRDRRAALAGISSYREECLRQGIPMMYPKGYLTHRRWEDEIDTDAAATKKEHPDGEAPAKMEEW